MTSVDALLNSSCKHDRYNQGDHDQVTYNLLEWSYYNYGIHCAFGKKKERQHHMSRRKEEAKQHQPPKEKKAQHNH